MFASHRRRLWAASFVATLALVPAAHGQTPKPSPTPSQKFAIPGSPDSASPGQKTPAQPAGKKSKKPARGARADARPRPGAPVATFPGFRLLPSGGSRIYVELTKNVNVDEKKTNGALVYTLRGAQVLSRNNKNALITTHFATPVARARLIPAGVDLDLVIDLRKAVDATHQIVAADNGTVRLEIDFPPGDYPLVPGLYEPAPGAASRSDRGAREEAPETIDDTNQPSPSRPTPTNAPPGPPPPTP